MYVPVCKVPVSEYKVRYISFEMSLENNIVRTSNELTLKLQKSRKKWTTGYLEIINPQYV